MIKANNNTLEFIAYSVCTGNKNPTHKWYNAYWFEKNSPVDLITDTNIKRICYVNLKNIH